MAFIKSDRDQIDLDVTATDIMLITKDDTTILTGATDTEAGLIVGTDKDRLDNLELNDLDDVTIVNAASGNDGKRYDIYRPVASSTGVVSQLMTKGVV